MTAADVAACFEVSERAFHELDRDRLRRGDPDPVSPTTEDRARWCARTTRFLDTDPDGCWVAEQDGEVLGFATSLRRERVWVLVTYAVRARHDGEPMGRRPRHASAPPDGDPGIPRAARHGATGAVHPQRRAALMVTTESARHTWPNTISP